jgi:hypothetical protein
MGIIADPPPRIWLLDLDLYLDATEEGNIVSAVISGPGEQVPTYFLTIPNSLHALYNMMIREFNIQSGIFQNQLLLSLGLSFQCSKN